MDGHGTGDDASASVGDLAQQLSTQLKKLTPTNGNHYMLHVLFCTQAQASRFSDASPNTILLLPCSAGARASRGRECAPKRRRACIRAVGAHDDVVVT